MQNIWNTEDQSLMERLKKDILSGPTLSIPDPSRRFYINTDWSKDRMGAVLLQEYVSEESGKSEAKEKAVKKCEFYKSLEGMRLRPIYSTSRSTVLPLEKSRHSFVLEAAAVRWAIGKFRKYLWRSEFTVLSDCSGMKKIFESEANITHVVHRW